MVADLDYLVATRVGVEAELTVLGELAGGACVLPGFEATELARCAEVIARHRDQSVGVADASLVVLADRFSTSEILTLDHRHFDVLRPLSGGRFTRLP